MAKIPVDALYENCRMMLDDHWGYIWGTAGKLWTAQLQANPPDEMAEKYGAQWIGHMVADCSGVMVYIWKQHGKTITHGSNSIARKHCGPTINTPKPGYAAFKWRDKDTDKYSDSRGDYYHIGIVGEDGKTVYESQGTRTGFITSPASSWACFAAFTDVDYTDQTQEGNVIYRAEVVTQSGSLNLRDGPGKEYKRIGSLPKGEIVDVLSEVGDWAYVMDDGISGYASKAYLRPVQASEAQGEQTVADAGKTQQEQSCEEDGMSYAVYVPCASREVAESMRATFPGAVLLAYKPPDKEGGD